MSVPGEVIEEDKEQESGMTGEEDREQESGMAGEEREEDNNTAQVSEETVNETNNVVEARESVMEEKEVQQMTDGDSEASKDTVNLVQESVVDIATNVELVKGMGVEGGDAVKQELTCMEKLENTEQVKDVEEETVQAEFAEKTCVEETEPGIQEGADVEERERVTETDVEQIKEVMPAEQAGNDQRKDVTHAESAGKDEEKDVVPAEAGKETCVQQTHAMKEVDVAQKALAMEEITHKEEEEEGEREDETENGSDIESFNFEDFEVVDEFEEEEEVGKSRGKSKSPSSTSQRRGRRNKSPYRRNKPHQNSSRSSRRHHSHSSHSRDRLKSSRENAKDKSGSSSRSSRTSSRYKEERSHRGHSRNKRRRDDDRSSDRRKQDRKSPRKEHKREKTQTKKRSAEDERSSSKRTKDKVNDKQSSRKDTSSSKKDRETATQPHSEKPARSPSTKRQKTLTTESSSATSQDATKQDKPGTQETSKGYNTLPRCDGSQASGLMVSCPDRNMEEAEATGNESTEKKVEVETGTDSKAPQVNSMNIEVNNEKLKENDKDLEVKERLKLNKDELQVVNKDSKLKVKNKELKTSITRGKLTNKKLKTDLKLGPTNTSNKEAEANSSKLESKKKLDTNVKESKTISIKSEPQTKTSKEDKVLEPRRESDPQLEKATLNMKSEPEELEPKTMSENLGKTQPEPEVIIKQSKPNKKEPAKVKEEKDNTVNQEMGISTRTRSARRSIAPVAAPKRNTRSQKKTAVFEAIVKLKKAASKQTVNKTQEELSKGKTDKEPKQVYKLEVCPRDSPLKDTVKSETVCEGSKKSSPLESTASEEVDEEVQIDALFKKIEEELHNEGKGNEESSSQPEECRKVEAEKVKKTVRKKKSSSVLQEEGDKCTTVQGKLEHCKKEVLGVVAQENTVMENIRNIPSEEDRTRTTWQEHPQGIITPDQDKAGHFQQDKLTDTSKKDNGDNIQHENCVKQITQENVANSSQTEDKCETSQNTIKEEDTPTQANDDEKINSCVEDNHCKEDTDSTETLDIKSNKRPLESADGSAKKKRKESAAGLSSAEHSKNEEKSICEEGGMKEGSDNIKNKDVEIKMEDTKTPEDVGKESVLKQVRRYSKVVVVGDARMSLLATADMKEELREVTQVIMVPNLTLDGILEVVQKEVVKEECPRGILLLCLAGLHGTLVELRVPQECWAAKHSDMHKMVPATWGDSLDPEFPKQLAKLKKKLREALGSGSNVLFFPVLPVDMANYNEIAAKHHFDATGHKLKYPPQVDSHCRHLQQYKKAVEEVNGPSFGYVKLVRFEFYSRTFCRKFTDALLQDGFNPTLDLVERHIVPQLQHTIQKSNTLRFQQVVLVGDTHLEQVVSMQQQEGVEPCTFILQEEPGLRSLTLDSPAVKQLLGMCNSLIFLTVTLRDLAGPTGKPQGEKAQCFLPHDPSEAFDNFLQEARRVDQMLHSGTYHCTIITTPVMPFSKHTITRDEVAGKTSSCGKCTKIAESVTLAVEQVSRIINRRNGLSVWNLNKVLERDKGVPSSSHQALSLSSEVVQKAATSWENFLNRCQVHVRLIPHVTITSVILQDSKWLSAILLKAIETSRTSRDKEETQHSHSKHRAQTHGSSHSRDKQQTHSRNKEQTHSRDKVQTHSRDKVQTHSRDKETHSREMEQTHSRDKLQTHGRAKKETHSRDEVQTHSRDKEETHSRDKEETHSRDEEVTHSRDKIQAHGRDEEVTHSRDKIQAHSRDKEDTYSREMEQTQNISSCRRNNEQTKDNYSGDGEHWRWRRSPCDLAFYSRDGEQWRWKRSPCVSALPAVDDITSPASSPDRHNNEDLDNVSTGNLSLTLSPSSINSFEDFMELSHDEYSQESHSEWHTKSQSLTLSPNPWRHSSTVGATPLDSPGMRLWSMNSRDRLPSPQRLWHSGLDEPRAHFSQQGSYSPSSRERVHSTHTYPSPDPQVSRARNRSFDPKKSGRRSRSVSPARLPLSPKRKPVYRRSLSRSPSPHQQHTSITGSTSFSKGGRSTSMERSISRGRRSVSRGRRSVSRSRRSRSNSMEQHTSVRLPVETPSIQPKTKESMVEEALKTLRSVHEKECEKYRSNPTIHPDIGTEYRLFVDKKTQSILALGGDPAQYNMADEWHQFWNKRMEEIFLESWRVKRNQCLDLLEAHQNQQCPLQQSLGHDESWQHTPKHTLGDPFPMQEHFREARSVAEDGKAEHPGQHKAGPDWAEPHRGKPHGIMQDQWLHLSSKKCVTASSGSPEAAVSEAQGKQDSWEHSKIKEGNLKHAFTGQPVWYKEHPEWQKAHASLASSQEGQAHQGTLKLNTMQPANKVTSGAPSRQATELDSHHNLGHTQGQPQKGHSAHMDDQDNSESISQIFKSFAANMGGKPSTAESTRHSHYNLSHTEGKPQDHSAQRDDQDSSGSNSQVLRNFAANTGDKPTTAGNTRHGHEDEVSSTTASSESKIDVVNVLEVLTHLGDKLGALCGPLKLLLERTKELQTNSVDPMTIINNQDNKLLLHMTQEKLEDILKDSKLNIIKKVIIQEAQQRLSVLLDLQEQQSLIGNLNLPQLAHHCLNMDTAATVDFIRKVLQCQGHTHLSEQRLMKLCMAVKAEQLKVVGDHHSDRTAATSTDNSHRQSHSNLDASLCPRVPEDSASPRHRSSAALSLPHTETHASTSRYVSPPWRGRQPSSDEGQSMYNSLDPGLQCETSSYPQEAVTGSSHGSSSRSATTNPSEAVPPSLLSKPFPPSQLNKAIPPSLLSKPFPPSQLSKAIPPSLLSKPFPPKTIPASQPSKTIPASQPSNTIPPSLLSKPFPPRHLPKAFPPKQPPKASPSQPFEAFPPGQPPKAFSSSHYSKVFPPTQPSKGPGQATKGGDSVGEDKPSEVPYPVPLRKVALFGHFYVSFLPLDQPIQYSGFSVRQFFKLDARVHSVRGEHIWEELQAYKPDLTYVTLGGNDLLPGTNVKQLSHNIKKLAMDIEVNTGSHCKVVGLEWKKNPCGLLKPEEYNRMKNAVNHRLRTNQYLTKKRYVAMGMLKADLWQRDHLDSAASQEVLDRFLNDASSFFADKEFENLQQ